MKNLSKEIKDLKDQVINVDDGNMKFLDLNLKN